MGKERFPKVRYLRQLGNMRQDLAEWRQQYLAAAAQTDNTYLRQQFTQRAQLLDETGLELHHAWDALSALPRLL